MQTSDYSQIEQAVISMIAERKACMEKSRQIEATLADYGVALNDSLHGTTWTLKSLVPEKTTTVKPG